MSSRLRLTALLAVLALALSGCGGSSDSSATVTKAPPTFTQAPATGDLMTGTGYSYTAPARWKKAASDSTTITLDSSAADSTDHDGFTDNLNVVRKASFTDIHAKGFQDALVDQLKKSDQFVTIAPRSPADIDGEVALRIDATQAVNGNKFTTEQYYASHDDELYVVTFAYDLNSTQAHRDEVAGSVLTTWKWSS